MLFVVEKSTSYFFLYLCYLFFRLYDNFCASGEWTVLSWKPNNPISHHFWKFSLHSHMLLHKIINQSYVVRNWWRIPQKSASVTDFRLECCCFLPKMKVELIKRYTSAQRHNGCFQPTLMLLAEKNRAHIRDCLIDFAQMKFNS